TMHKSQGFGSSPRYGELYEYLIPWNEASQLSESEFVALGTRGWADEPALQPLAERFAQVVANFSPTNPAASVDSLLAIRGEAPGLGLAVRHFHRHLTRMDAWMAYAMGLRMRAQVDQPFLLEGTEAEL
ncbi:hypothetical protein RZS08_37485, partial [Arthrospira platensis SPKY1]|nr:hypothetical protein [Arthrospira platensis SPKY1]